LSQSQASSSKAKKKKSAQAADLSFEEALARLEAIVVDLEDGEIGLSESLARYEEGIKLLGQCHGLLEGAERRVALLSGFDSEGNPVTEPFDEASAQTLDEKSKARSRRRTHRSKSSTGDVEVDDSGGLF